MSIKPLNSEGGFSVGDGTVNPISNVILPNSAVNTVSLTTLHANLGNVSNVKIFGGNSNYILQTDGSGNLTWVENSGGSLSVSEANANAANIGNTTSNVTGLLFDRDSGFSVSNVGNGNVLIQLGSTFKTWVVTGQSNLVAQGEDTVQFIAGNNLVITTSNTPNPPSDPYKFIRFDADVSYISNGNSNVTIGMANGNVGIAVGGNTGIAVFASNIVQISKDLTVNGNFSAANAELGNLANANFLSGYLTGNSQPNITTVGTLTNLDVNGDTYIGGNLTVDGNLIYVNVSELSVQDPIIQLQTGPNGAAPNSNSGKDVGLALNYYDTNAKVAWMGWDVSNTEISFGSNTTISNEVVTINQLANIRAANAVLGNLVIANYFQGQLNGEAQQATVVTAASQGNITSVGTLVALDITGNLTAGNANLGNSVTANYFIGRLHGQANTANTVIDNSQPNITSVGTLTSLDITGNLTAGNANLGNSVTANYFTGNFYGPANSALTVTDGNQFNITALGNLTNLTVLGPANLGNVSNVLIFGGSNGQVLTTNGSGNLSWVTISVSSISNGNSNISIPAANGNVNISAEGNSNVLVITGTGANIAGTANVTGNANVGNLGTEQVLATANITAPQLISNIITGTAPLVVTSTTVVANLNANALQGNTPSETATANSIVQRNADGNITANFFIGNGSQLTGVSTSIISNGNSNVSIPAANGNVNISAEGNANILVVTGTGANIAGTANVTGNANVGNLGTEQVLATANITAPQLISNISTGTAPLVVISTTVVANLNANALQGNTPSETATANSIVQRNADGNITANFFIGNGSQLTGLSTSSISNGNSNVSIPAANGNVNISAEGNANILVITGTGANITGTLNANGNANVGNLGTAGTITATGNITAGAVTYANTDGTANQVLTTHGNGITYWSTVSGTSISNGNSNVSIPAANGNVNISAEGNANILVITGTGANITGTANVTGNANVGNLGTTGTITATGTITVGAVTYANSDGTANQVLTTYGNGITYWSTVSGGNSSVGGSNTQVQFNDGGSFGGNNSFTFDKTTSNLTVTGNIIGRLANGVSNIGIIANNDIVFNVGGFSNTVVIGPSEVNVFSGSGGDISGANKIYANLFVGVLGNGNSNVSIPAANGNVNISAEGNANIVIVTGTGANIAGTANVTGNIAGGGNLNISGNAVIGGNLTVDGNLVYVNVTDLAVEDPIIQLQVGANGAPLTSNTGKDVGTALNYYDTSAKVAFMGWDVSNAEIGFGSQVSISSEVVTFTEHANIRAGNANLGNVVSANFFIGNGSQLTGLSTSSISNGNSNVNIATSGGNVTVGVAGVANVVTISNSEMNVGSGTGGNISGANVISSNTLTTTDKITVGTVQYANTDGTADQVLTTYGNGITYWSTVSGNSISNGNSNVSIPAANGNVNISAVGNANILVITGTGANITGTANITGNANVGNLGTAGRITATGNITAGAVTYANTDGTANQVLTTYGNGITYWSTVSAASISNISNGNSNVNIPAANGNVNISAEGNANVLVVTGTGANITGTANVTGNANVGNLGTTNIIASGNANVGQINLSGSIIPTANVTYNLGNNTNRFNDIYLANSTIYLGSAQVSSNATSISLTNPSGGITSISGVSSDISAGSLTVTGNVTGGNISANFFIGNGSQLTGVSTSSISNGNSNVSIPTANGNVNISAVGNANVLVITGTGANIAGTANITGNANVGNLGTEQVLATANITAPQFISNVSTGTAPLVVTSTTVVANLNANALQGNTPSETATSNSIVQRNADGNITANFFIGNGSQLTGLSTSSISNGNSNVSIPAANGNVNISAVGNANILVITGTGANITGTANVTGNITGNSLIASTLLYSSRFIESPYPIVAPLKILNKGTGALTSITSAIATGSFPQGLAVDPSGRFVYVTNRNSDTVSQYSINQSTGELTSITTAIATGAFPVAVAVDPSGRFAYVTSYTASTISQHSINQSTGVLTSITSTIASPQNTNQIAVDPSGRFVYAVGYSSGTVGQYSINQSTGALTSITTAIAAGTNPNTIAIDPSGRFVYVTNGTSNTVSQYSINQSTGALTSITTAIAAGTNPSGVAVDPSGRFVYVTNSTSNNVNQYSINQSTGALTSITTAIAAGTGAQSVAVDPSGRFVYVTNRSDYTVSQYSINQSTGELTSITTAIAAGTLSTIVAVDPSGRFVYVTNSGSSTVSQYSINNFASGSASVAGTLTASGNISANFFIGNGSQLTGLSATSIANGNSNVSIPAANGNVNISAVGNANILVVTGTGANIAGTLNASGNANVGNLGVAQVLATANITAPQLISNVSTGTAPLVVTSTTVVANLNANALQGNTPSQTATANSIVQRNADGNITANFFIGNGSQLTGISLSSISNGNSNVNIPSANGNVNISAVGNANILVITGTGANIAGTANVTSNIVGGGNLNISGNAVISGNLTVDGNLVYVNVTDLAVEDPIIQLQVGANGAAPISNSGKDVGTALNYYDSAAKIAFMGWDVSNAEMGFASQVSISSEVVTFTQYANIRAGNANLGNAVSANFFIGNGSQLTGISLSSISNGNSNVSIPASNGNVNISAEGNANVLIVTGTGANIAGTANITGNANVGNLGVAQVLASANITAPQLISNISTGTAPFVVTSTTVVANLNANSLQGNTPSDTATANSIVQRNSDGNITANFFIGNGSQLTGISLSSISNGNSNVSIPAANGNVTISAEGNANILVITGTGANIAGTANVTGNANVGNLGAAQILASSNITAPQLISNISTGTAPLVVTSTTVVANLNSNSLQGNTPSDTATANSIVQRNADGNITANFFIGNGSQLTGLSATSIANGNSNVSIPAANGNVNISAEGNANILVVTGTGANISGTANVTGNANVGNLGAAQILASSNITAPQLISNISTGTAPLVVTSTTVVANLNANALQGNTPSDTATANSIVQRNADGNITANFFIGNGSQLTGISLSSISNGNSNVSIPAANGNVNISAEGNANILVITGTGVNVSGTLNASGNANVGNLSVAQVLATANITAPQLISNVSTGTAPFVVTSTTVVANLNANALQGNTPSDTATANSIAQRNADGNITANFFIGNGSQLTGLSATSIANGNSNVSIPAANGNVNISAEGNANVLVVTGTGANIAGTANVTGNANVGNLGAAQVLATANITAPQLISNISTGTAPLVVTSTTVVANLNANALQGNTPSNTATANSIVQRNADGNITANFFIGNGSQLTGLSTSSISNGNSNVSIPAANGNVNISAEGNANVLVVTGTGANIAGTANVTTNIVGGGNLNISGNAVISGNLTVDGNLVYVNVTDLAVEDPIIQLQVGANGAAPISNSGKDVGTALNYYDSAAKIAFMGWDVSNAEMGFASQVSISSEVVTFTQYANIRAGNANLGNVVSANFGTFVNNVISNNFTVNLELSGNTANFSGNANVGNLGVAQILASANITAPQFISNISTGTAPFVVTSTTVVANLNANALQGNTPSDTATANSIVQRNADGNITANFFIGNGSQLTGLSTSSISNGNSNVNIPAANGNVNISAEGNANILVVTGTGVNVAGTLNATGNSTFANASITGGITSSRSNVGVTTNTVVDQFAIGTYRTAKYVISASGDDGFQSVETLLVHDGSNSFITIYASICSNTAADIIDLTSNINGGNVKLYATSSSANALVNIVAMYVKT